MSEPENIPLGSDGGQVHSERRVPRDLLSLQKHYTFVDPVVELLDEEPSLYPLLIEAVRPLDKAFGKGRVRQVRAQFADEDSLIKVAVQLPADFVEDPEAALASFDKDWWVDNCHRANGGLVFDYELQDAV